MQINKIYKDLISKNVHAQILIQNLEAVNSIYNSASVYAPLDEFPELLEGA